MKNFVSRSILASLAIVIVSAGCRDSPPPTPTAPTLLGARSSASKVTLEVVDGGSTVGGTVTSNRGGIGCTIPGSPDGRLKGKCSQHFNTGTVVTLTATPVATGTRITWTGCTGATDDPFACEVALDFSRTVKVAFSPPALSQTLDVTSGAEGSGRITSSVPGIDCTITGGSAASTGCRAAFPTGTAVTLTATAASGSYLKAWAGAGCDAAGTGAGTMSGRCDLTMDQPHSIVVSFGRSSEVAALGRWDAPISWSAVAIHASVLPNGRVMTWGRSDHAPLIWDPANPASFTNTARPSDLFCSGHAFLPDGRLLVAGGHSGTDNQGIRDTEIFDYRTNSWTDGPDMRDGRWYPTNTALPSGEVLTLSGGDTLQQRNLIPEVWQANGSWRVLSTASLYLPYYPWMFVAPDGRVFAAGPSQTTYYLDPAGTGRWSAGPSSRFGSRDYGSAVMYDVGKILIVGGGTPTNTAEVIDISTGAGAWRSVGSLSVARRQTNATLLADGKVLVTGGTNSGGFNTAPTDTRVLAAEMWNPTTETWTTLGRMTHNRLYHSTALLLPDARVLSVGSGQPAATGLTDDYTAEIFSPPYLFNPDGTAAARPAISSAPSTVGYGQSFTLQSADAASITKVTWIRLGSVTHAFNQNQRMNYLPFSVSGTGALTVTAPANGNVAPPGHYMLFIVNGRGVPSVAKIVQIN
jgi:WD40 repeat protein